jgi:hypothetical protein
VYLRIILRGKFVLRDCSLFPSCPVSSSLPQRSGCLIHSILQIHRHSHCCRGVVSFQRPSYYHFRTKEPDGAYKKRLQIYAVPIQAGKVRVLFESPGPKWLPTWLAHAGSNRFLNTDVWLHATERKARSMGQDADVNDLYVMASSSDLGVKDFRKVGRYNGKSFRRKWGSGRTCLTIRLSHTLFSCSAFDPPNNLQWWKKNGYAKAPPHTFGPSSIEQLGSTAMTRAEQIDPWIHHVKHCSACRDSLIKWKVTQKASLAFSFLSVALLGRRKPVVAAILSLMGLGLHNFSKKVATIMEGNPHQSEITDRSAASMKD